MKASELQVGDEVLNVTGGSYSVEKMSVEVVENPEAVYNFHIEEFHTYYVGDSSVLVHNRCGGDSSTKPYADSRPSYGENQVDEVWKNAKDPITGKVYDPSGVEITWDKAKSRNGQWDMGHLPEQKYSDMHQLYMDDVISKDEFLEWYRNPKNYRPELPSTNRSHKYE